MLYNNMYLSRYTRVISSLIVFLFLVGPSFVNAGLGLLDSKAIEKQVANDREFRTAATFADTSSKTLPTAVALVINVFIGLLGTIFLILIVVSGWNWFTAQGDTKKIDTAKARMVNAIIGLVIVISAYAITVFIFRTGDELQLMSTGS